MNAQFRFNEAIDLFVKGRISREDAERQERTARELLRRLESQPGLILADEVGMGKTFVALAVALSVQLSDEKRRPVVIMVPPSLKDKWPRDFSLFMEKCLPEKARRSISFARAESAVEFLKLLDDPIKRRKSIIFLTHGAMRRGLDDGWVKLALIWRALYKRKHTRKMKLALYRVLGPLLYLSWAEKRGSSIWEDLLRRRPEDWLKVLKRHGVDPEGDRNPDTDDDPVPEAVIKALPGVNADAVYAALDKIPYRHSESFENRLVKARQEISNVVRELWKSCIQRLQLKLPLLILDEAHHLKNEKTQFASLFRIEDAKADMEEIKGPLAGVFERMLFLTATPFQLGHFELCSVLQRFGSIDWDRPIAPEEGRDSFLKKIEALRNSLDEAQSASLRLESAWGSLQPEDLEIDKRVYADVEEWWKAAKSPGELSPSAQRVVKRYGQVYEAMRNAEKLLKPLVIRHLKKRTLPEAYGALERRKVFRGREIADEVQESATQGLSLDGESLVPFLLACRTVACRPDKRPVFAEGLASSYEAFLFTRRQCQERTKDEQSVDPTDIDDEPAEPTVLLDRTGLWYLDKLEQFLPRRDLDSSLSHPKIKATVERVLRLWKSGEKVLVFCHFIATGKVLRQHISRALEGEIRREGARSLGCSPSDVFEELELIGKRFFDEESPLRRACDQKVRRIIARYKALKPYQESIIDIVRRYVRTPSFLVRYMPLEMKRLTRDSMTAAFLKSDESGLTLERIIEGFFEFLVEHCGQQEKLDYLGALESVKPGAYMTIEVEREFWDEERKGERTEKAMANVRLVNGETKSEIRKNLMLTFNTPFFPEILIASSVMAEGVDLHLNCRHVIHHDLCWNPSTLEQRTGRVDRIGAKAERCGKSIYIYLPYIAETQDEKMYRVVMDRERWFKVIMGEKYKVDACSIEKIAQRITFPEALAEDLAFSLEVM